MLNRIAVSNNEIDNDCEGSGGHRDSGGDDDGDDDGGGDDYSLDLYNLKI